MAAKLPRAGADLIPGQGPMSPEYYRYFSQQQAGSVSGGDSASINARLNALQAEINALPDPQTFRVLPPLILSDGILRIIESPTASASARSMPQSWVFA